MAHVLIRDAEDVKRLQQIADRRGMTLAAHLRELVESARPSRRSVFAEIKALREKSRPWSPGEPTAVDLVREGRRERAETLSGRPGSGE